MSEEEQLKLAVFIESPIDLLNKLAQAEEEYRREDLAYDKEYNREMAKTNWNEINKEREADGLNKITSDKLRQAYVEDKLYKYKEDKVQAQLRYNRLNRMYEMAKKYSFDILR